MIKVKSHWSCFLERLLTAVILTCLLRVYPQALGDFPPSLYPQGSNLILNLTDASRSGLSGKSP